MSQMNQTDTNISISTCHLSNDYNYATYILNITAYWILPPFYFLFGMAGHIICILVFKKEAKVNIAYGYQVLVTVCKMIEITVISVYILFSNFSGFGPSGGFDLFQSNYALMVSMTRICIPGQGIVASLSLLALSVMAVDRAMALYNPIYHKHLNHKRNQMVAGILCPLIAVLISADTFFRFNVVQAGKYLIVQNTDLLVSQVVFHMNNIRQLVRFVALVAMIAANAIFVRRYRTRVKKVGSTALQQRNNQSSVEKRAKEKTLFTIVVIVSAMCALSTTWLLVSSMLYVVWPTFTGCEGKIIIHVYTSTMLITRMAEFYLVLLANKPFRMAARAVIKSYHEKFLNVVTLHFT